MANIVFATWDGGGNLPAGHRHRRRTETTRRHPSAFSATNSSAARS